MGTASHTTASIDALDHVQRHHAQPLQVRQRPSKRACYSIRSVLGGQLNALSRPIQRMIPHKKGVAFQHFSAGATEKSSGWDFSFYGSDGLFSL